MSGPRQQTDESRARISETRRKRAESDASVRRHGRTCAVCGRRANRAWRPQTPDPDAVVLTRFRRRWLCERCLSDDAEPIRIEDFARQPGALSWAQEVG